jgi:hypothetical protein
MLLTWEKAPDSDRVKTPQASPRPGRLNAVPGSGRRRADMEHPTQDPADGTPEAEQTR